MNLGRVLAHAAGDLAGDMKENRDFVRSAKDRLSTDLFAQGQERRNSQKKARKAMDNAVEFLTDQGLEREKLLYLLSEDPKELLSLAEISKQRYSEGTLNRQALNSAVELAQNFEAPDMTPTELIKRATTDFVKAADSEIPEDKRNLVQRLFQRPGMDVIAGEVYASEILPGVTGADISASMQADAISTESDTKSGKINYKGLQPRDQRLIRDIQKDITLEYNTALDDYLTSLRNNTDPGNQAEIERLKKLAEMDNGKIKLQKIMEVVGFDIAKDYYVNSPQVFEGSPNFVSQEYLENYIAGDEDFAPGDDSSDDTSPEVEVPEIDLEDSQEPTVEAKKWFGKQGNEAATDVQVNMPDGSTRMFRRVIGEDGRATIQEVG